jgi:hypothetical protein
MRELLINSLDKLIVLLVALIVLIAVVGGFVAMAQQGFLAGLAIIIGGGIYAIIFGGMMFLVIGIHANTKRTAELLETMAAKK